MSIKIFCRLSNEVSHGGNHTLGFAIAYQHEAWYQAIKDIIPLDRVINDTSYSDFVIGALCEEHDAFGTIIGKDEYDRRCWIELHCINPWRLNEPVDPLELEDLVQIFLSDNHDMEAEILLNWEGYDPKRNVDYDTIHAMPELAKSCYLKNYSLFALLNGGCGWSKFVLSTDGNDRGSGYQIPGTDFRSLSKDELGQLCRRAWNPANVSTFIIADLPMEVLFRNAQGILEEDYRRIDFSRLAVFAEVWQSLKG